MVVGRVLLASVAFTAAMVAAIPIIAVGLPFWLVAIITRVQIPLFRPATVRWPELFVFHPILGWKAKPAFNGHCLEERDDIFHVVTDPDGWPGQRSLSESRIVVIGDSMAFGYGVATKNAFFELNPGMRIKAVGAPGYNMVQELLLMEELSPSLKGKDVLWFVYFGNDLYDNLSPEMTGYRAPFVAQNADGDWQIITTHISPSKWSCSVGRQGKVPYATIKKQLMTKSFMGDRAYSACEFLLGKGRDICRTAGAELIIMTVPFPMRAQAAPFLQPFGSDQDYPDRRIRAICEKLQVPCVALRNVLTPGDYKRWDEHWNERGHRKVAQAISALYKADVRNQEQEATTRSVIRTGDLHEA
jgi:hypothetical protein